MRNPKSQYNPAKDLIIATRLREMGKQKKQRLQHLLSFFEGYIHNLLYDAHNSLCLLYSCADFTRDRKYVSFRLKNEGFAFVADVLPALMSGVLSQLEGRESTFNGFFKIEKATGRPAFLRRLTEIATNENNYSTTEQARALEIVYNISVCGKKYRGEPDVQSHQQQWDEFCEVDKLLGKIDFDSPELEPILASISTQWNNFAHGMSLDDPICVPRPGPGATVNSLPKHMRFAPHVMYKQLHDVFPYEDWFYPHMYDVVSESQNYKRLLNNAVDTQYSEYLLVPKTYRKWRGICKEANEAQYLQQGLRRLLGRWIDRFLGKHLPLTDQGVHGKRALASSINRRDATIDESEASDRIARALVSHMTKGTPEIHHALLAVSSSEVRRVNKSTGSIDTLQTAKFAPMGSAVCFPIMSIVHLFIIRAVILIYMTDITYQERKTLCDRVSVYGDDVILPHECVDLVYMWLPKFGMKINQTKSFVKSHFRESCGCHAYKGCDITPVYIKYTTFSSKDVDDNKKLLSLLANERDLYLKGFRETARFIRDSVVAKWRQLPYVTYDSPVVGFKRPPFHPDLTDFSLKPKRYGMKWNRFLQTYSFRLPTFVTESEKGIIPSDTQGLLRQYCLKPKRDVNYVWAPNGIKTPFRMDEWIRRLDDKTIRLKQVVVPLMQSAFHGHTFERICVESTMH